MGTRALDWLREPYVPVLSQGCNDKMTLGLFSHPMNWVSQNLSFETTPHTVTAYHLPS